MPKTYLDDNGNPIPAQSSPGKTYLDESGNPMPASGRGGTSDHGDKASSQDDGGGFGHQWWSTVKSLPGAVMDSMTPAAGPQFDAMGKALTQANADPKAYRSGPHSQGFVGPPVLPPAETPPSVPSMVGRAAGMATNAGIMTAIGEGMESPSVRGFASGAIKAIPGAVKNAIPYGGGAVLMQHFMPGPIATAAEGVAALSAAPEIFRAGVSGATGKNPLGPIGRSILPDPPAPIPISRSPVWSGIQNARTSPLPVPGSRLGQNPFAEALDPVESLPSGREVGGIHNIPPTPIAKPLRVSLPQQYGVESSPLVVPDFSPIMSDLPSGRFPVSSKYPEPPVAAPAPRVSLAMRHGLQPSSLEVPGFSPISSNLPSGRSVTPVRFPDAPHSAEILSGPLTPPERAIPSAASPNPSVTQQYKPSRTNSRFDADGKRLWPGRK